MVVLRIHNYLFQYERSFLSPNALHFLVLFLLGMLVLRSGLATKLSDKKWLWRAFGVVLICIAVGAVWNQYSHAWWPPLKPALGWRDARYWYPQGIFYGIGDDLQTWGTSAAYASALALLALWRKRSVILGALAAVGRMPLTTYLTQSVICTTLFYGYGFGLWGQVGGPGKLGITVVVFSAQMVASIYWLRHFRFGPAEWLWRSLAYLRAQPMKRLSSIQATGS